MTDENLITWQPFFHTLGCYLCLFAEISAVSGPQSLHHDLAKWRRFCSIHYISISRRLLKFQRVLGHFLCIIILGSSAYAVWLTVQRSAEFAKIQEAGGTLTFFQANEVGPKRKGSQNDSPDIYWRCRSLSSVPD